jgi:hypothetical protein
MPEARITISKYFFRAQVRGETDFIDHVVGQANGYLLRENAACSVGDVGEGTGVHQRRCALGGLHQVGQNGVVEQGHHGSGSAQIGGSDGTARAIDTDHDCIQAAAEIGAA